MELPAKRREPQPLEIEEIQKIKEILSPEWSIEANRKIKRQFTFPNFKEALAFVVNVGQIAEELHHHPDIGLTWGKVEIASTTHSINFLSKKDFELAERIDAAFATFF